MYIIYEFQPPSKRLKKIYTLQWLGKKGFSLFSDTKTPWTGDGHFIFKSILQKCERGYFFIEQCFSIILLK